MIESIGNLVASGLFLSAFTLLSIVAGKFFSATVRLIISQHSPAAVTLLLNRLASTTRARQSWPATLRSLRLQLPWPWPWRINKAIRNMESGWSECDTLLHSNLLPKPLRHQATHALHHGPETFDIWCGQINDVPLGNRLTNQQSSFVLFQALVVLGIIHFQLVVIFPKFNQIFLELGLYRGTFFRCIEWVMAWEQPLAWSVVLVVLISVYMKNSWHWRLQRCTAAGHLILTGAAARLPEAAMGMEGNFSTVCNQSGWKCDSVLSLARAINRHDFQRRKRAAWQPAFISALVPLLWALPVGFLTIGIMNMFLVVLYAIDNRMFPS